jgi:hypothetical protein
VCVTKLGYESEEETLDSNELLTCLLENNIMRMGGGSEVETPAYTRRIVDPLHGLRLLVVYDLLGCYAYQRYRHGWAVLSYNFTQDLVSVSD